ncbi:MAG: hypothetical protein RLZZ301_1123 [Bacteroidota bacterium]|jgi:hypothetical protein
MIFQRNKASLFLLLFASSSLQLVAQAVSEKKLQGGVVGAVGMNFPKMGTSLLASASGFSSSFGVSFIKATKESQNIAFTGGLEFDIEKINYSINDKDVFYRYTDKQIKTKDETVQSTDLLYNLKARTYNPLYLDLPIGMAFRTDFMGDYRGVFKFGLRNRFLMTNTIDDQGAVVNQSTGQLDLQDNIGMKCKNDLFFYNATIGFSAGVEWNFAGSTSLLIEAGYNYGFMPLHLTAKEQNYSLFTQETPGVPSYFRNQATLNSLQLKMTLLF